MKSKAQSIEYKNKNYDPIKIMNKRRFLNEISIKCRYDLIHMDDFYKRNNINFENKKKAFKHNVAGKINLDKDFIDFNEMVKNMPLSYLVNRAEAIDKKIKESNVLEILDTLDHTSGNYIKMLCPSKLKETNDIKILKFYRDHKLKEKKDNFIKSRKHYIEFNNLNNLKVKNLDLNNKTNALRKNF